MARYSNNNINPLGVLKAIMSEGTVVNQWWKTEGWNRTELLNYFSSESLKKGLQNAITAGEIIPKEVYEQFPEFKQVSKEMQVITHPSLKSLQAAAKEKDKEVLETVHCYSFRIFENRTCTEFHVFKK